MAENLDQYLLHANAVLVTGDFFTDREKGDDGPDLKRTKAIWSLLSERKAPFILSMNCPTWGDPSLFAWMEQEFSGVPIYQKNLEGGLEDGSDGSPAYLCLDHRGVRSYIQRTYEAVIEEMKLHDAHEFLIGYSGSPHPLIVQRHSRQGRGGSHYCVNPETITAWREDLRERYEGNITAFNRDFHTVVRVWSDIPEPDSAFSRSPLQIDFETHLYQTVHGFQDWNLDLINRLDPSKQVFNYGSNISTGLASKVINQFGSFDSGAISPYVPGGDILTVPGHLADGPAYLMDGYRSFGPAALVANQLALSDGSAPTGQELRFWFAQMASRFKTVYALPAAWEKTENTAALQEAFRWGMQLGTLDVGEPQLPSVAVMSGYAARCADGPEVLHKRQEVYRQLYRAGVDRVLVSERQIANGWLRKSHAEVLVLPHVRVISEAALNAIHEWTQMPQKRLIVLGEFAELDADLQKNKAFEPIREELLASVGTRTLEGPTDRLGRVVRSAAGRTYPLTPGVEMAATSKGWCLVQAAHFVDVDRVDTPPAEGSFDILIDGETIRDVPVQYFTFLFKEGSQWNATTINEAGEFETVKINGNT